MFVCRRLQTYAAQPGFPRAPRASESQSERDEDGVDSGFEHVVSRCVHVSFVLLWAPGLWHGADGIFEGSVVVPVGTVAGSDTVACCHGGTPGESIVYSITIATAAIHILTTQRSPLCRPYRAYLPRTFSPTLCTRKHTRFHPSKPWKHIGPRNQCLGGEIRRMTSGDSRRSTHRSEEARKRERESNLTSKLLPSSALLVAA